MTRIAYLVHDLTDAAVARRVTMFRAGGAEVALAGFQRRGVPADVAGVVPVDLGHTADAALGQRARAVLRHVAAPGRVRQVTTGADTIVARNLECLALAVRAAAGGQRIVFECLDIHRVMLGEGAKNRAMRALEAWLMRRVDLLVTSSPAFVREYFAGRQRWRGAVHVEENRLLTLGGAAPVAAGPALAADPGERVRIGWFGMLRCRRSLAILRALAVEGRAEVLLAGVPARTEFEDFDRDVAGVPGLTFAGRYTAADLPDLYGRVDLAWAIDYFEAGLNSSWLLPNRLYESLAYGVVPVAQRGVETARWLEAHGVGLVLDDPAAEAGTVLGAIDAPTLARLREGARRVPREAVIADAQDCARLTRIVTGAAA